MVAVRRTDEVLELTVRGPTVSSDARHGDSIAVSGVCLTVTAVERRDGRRADAAPTMPGGAPSGSSWCPRRWRARAWRACGGHPGQPGTCRRRRRPPRRPHRAGPCRRRRHPAAPRPRCAQRRAVLQPARAPGPVRGGEGVDHRRRGVAHRRRHRRRDVLGGADPDDAGAHHTRIARAVGDTVNLEVDVVAKYVERLMAGYAGPTERGRARRVRHPARPERLRQDHDAAHVRRAGAARHRRTIAIGDRVVCDPATGFFVPPDRRPIGMVFQSYAIWPHMTVFDNVAFPLRMRRSRKPRSRTRRRRR